MPFHSSVTFSYHVPILFHRTLILFFFLLLLFLVFFLLLFCFLLLLFLFTLLSHQLSSIFQRYSTNSIICRLLLLLLLLILLLSFFFFFFFFFFSSPFGFSHYGSPQLITLCPYFLYPQHLPPSFQPPRIHFLKISIIPILLGVPIFLLPGSFIRSTILPYPSYLYNFNLSSLILLLNKLSHLRCSPFL